MIIGHFVGIGSNIGARFTSARRSADFWRFHQELTLSRVLETQPMGIAGVAVPQCSGISAERSECGAAQEAS